MPRTLVRRQAAVIAGAEELSPLLSRLYSGRGVRSARELDHKLGELLPPDSMQGVQDAARLLGNAIRQQQRILIIGDFDADGATSSALMVSVLRAMGAEYVNYLVPNRFDYGYGLTPEIVDVARQFEPDIIVTVDNGISSLDGVARARSLGMQVLITDHHLPGATLPDADAIVNPNQGGCDFESKSLAGVGVAFYLLSALRQWLRGEHWFDDDGPRLADYLDLVALGTIADVVPMDRNNRILVQEGIRRIRAGRARPGIYALIGISGADYRTVTSRDLAFGVGPRINAAGRLEDMSLGIECLLATENRAQALAQKLDEINKDRKAIESDMKDQAEAELDTQLAGIVDSRVGICLHHAGWHQGVVGIIASRIKDKLHRPVIAFATASDGELKGSGRSIKGLHIRDALDAIATRNPGLLSKFGGHAMAAGLSLDASNLKKFAEEFDTEAKRWLNHEDLEDLLISDGELEAIDLALAKQVVDAAPWGQGFAEPVFDGNFEVIDQRIVGERHLKLKLRPESSQQVLEAIAFNHPFLLENRHLRLAYRLDVNRYRGSESVQLIVECTDLKMPGQNART